MADNQLGDPPTGNGQDEPPEPTPDSQAPSEPVEQTQVGGASGREAGGTIEGHIDRAVERSLRWPESIMAVFTIVIAFTAVAQCHEMSTSGIDTHDLASDTQRLANAAADQALAASDQAASLSSAAATATDQLRTLKDSVRAAQQAADAAKSLTQNSV